ncbi:MAG: LysR family transcriptional regulator [Rhizobiaceae bacterium]|nr:LysR family transcriptional regulator [Rhizobiaceae bacterium]
MVRLLNRLDIKDYRLIHSISQTGQLALSAQALSMTQPAASRMLASIESRIGERLFRRHPKGMTPTAVGEVLAQRSAAILRNLDATEREVIAVSRGQAGTARIGAVTGAVVAFVVPGLQILKETTEGSEVHVDVGPSSMLIEGLLKGYYDFILSRLPTQTDLSLFAIQRARVEVVQFLVRAGHPMAGRGKLNLNDLQSYQLVIQPPLTPMREAVDEAYVARGVPSPPEIIVTTSLLVMISYLRSTDAITPVSREVGLLFAESNEHWTALELEDPIIIRPYYLISRKHEPMNQLAGRLHNIIGGLINGESAT